MFSGRHFKYFMPLYNTKINITEKNGSVLVVVRDCYSLVVLTSRERGSGIPT